MIVHFALQWADDNVTTKTPQGFMNNNSEILLIFADLYCLKVETALPAICTLSNQLFKGGRVYVCIQRNIMVSEVGIT